MSMANVLVQTRHQAIGNRTHYGGDAMATHPIKFIILNLMDTQYDW